MLIVPVPAIAARASSWYSQPSDPARPIPTTPPVFSASRRFTNLSLPPGSTMSIKSSSVSVAPAIRARSANPSFGSRPLNARLSSQSMAC